MTKKVYSPVSPQNSVESQTELAVLGLRDLLLSGEFQAGDRLPELMLVERLGVSRTPIRTALQRLAEEGLLESKKNIGYTVRGFSERDINDAIELRGMIEGLAARMAAEQGVSEELLGEMRDCLDLIDLALNDNGDTIERLRRYQMLNVHFHQLLVKAAGSSVLERELERINAMPFASVSAFTLVQADLPSTWPVLHIAQDQHREIVAAIENRSSSRVEPMVREHARLALRNLRAALGNSNAMRHLPGAPLIRRSGKEKSK